jgi:hypothetical protein
MSVTSSSSLDGGLISGNAIAAQLNSTKRFAPDYCWLDPPWTKTALSAGMQTSG